MLLTIVADRSQRKLEPSLVGAIVSAKRAIRRTSGTIPAGSLAPRPAPAYPELDQASRSPLEIAMNFNSLLIGSENPQRLVEYYTKLFGEPGFTGAMNTEQYLWSIRD